MEIWKNVIPYVWVSNLGNYRIEAREYPVHRYGKLTTLRIKEKTVITEKGKYYQLTVDKKHWYLHQLVALAFPEICGEYFEGADVDHIIPINQGGGNEATNLHFCTRKENLNNPNRIKQSEEEKKKLNRERVYKYFIEHKEELYERKKKNYVKGSRNEYMRQYYRKKKSTAEIYPTCVP